MLTTRVFSERIMNKIVKAKVHELFISISATNL